MKVYRIEHPATGHGIFRTDWEDIRHHGFLKKMKDSQLKAYRKMFKHMKEYNANVVHNTPQGEAMAGGIKAQRQYALACALLEWDEDHSRNRHLTVEERLILKQAWINARSKGQRPLCAAPNLSVLATWIDMNAIQYLQMTGFKLYEISLKVRKVVHYTSDTQVVYFPEFVKSKKEICLSELANTEIEFEDEDWSIKL